MLDRYEFLAASQALSKLHLNEANIREGNAPTLTYDEWMSYYNIVKCILAKHTDTRG